MAYQYQLKDARDSLALKSIAGICTDTNEFVAILNEAMRRLNRRGNFFDTEQLARFCLHNGCITWPRYIGTILGVKFCTCSPSEIRNNWYAILGPRGCNRWMSSHTVRDNGTASTYAEITGDGKYIRAYLMKNEDAGKAVRLYGVDSNGQPLQEKVNGAWRPGLTLRLQAPYAQTTVLVRSITSVTKDVTQGNVLLYEYDTTSATLRDIALYEPSETNPRYRRSVIDGFNCIPTACSENDGVRLRTVEVMVKLNFIDVRDDYDFLPIDNFDAIKFMIQAIRLEEANQEGQAEQKIVKAIREMNFELRDRSPGQQATIRVNMVGRQISNPI